MKSFDTELKKHADKIRLRASERRELRERVLSYMEYHPLPKQASVKTELKEAIKSDSFVVLGIHSRIVQIAAAAFVLVMVVIPFAAERAVPGDVLYIVKTGINEPVQSSLASSPYEKIEFETKLMERRIAEARVLASEGKLTDDVKTKIAETVKEHSDAVQTELQELRNQDAEGAAIAQIAFSSSLEVQSAVLTEDDEEVDASDPILTVVKEAREVSEKEKGSTTPSYDGLMARIELETTRAYELFETVKESATEDEITDIERRFADINRVIEETREDRVLDETKSASDLAKILGQVKKLIFFMADINIRESVSLEALVPIILSDQERIDLVKEELRVIDGMKRDIYKILEAIDESEIPNKIEPGLEEVETNVLQAQTALDVQDILKAEEAVRKGRELAGDLLAILRPSAQLIEIEETEASTSTSTSTPSEGGSEETPSEEPQEGTVENPTEPQEGVNETQGETEGEPAPTEETTTDSAETQTQEGI